MRNEWTSSESQVWVHFGTEADGSIVQYEQVLPDRKGYIRMQRHLITALQQSNGFSVWSFDIHQPADVYRAMSAASYTCHSCRKQPHSRMHESQTVAPAGRSAGRRMCRTYCSV